MPSDKKVLGHLYKGTFFGEGERWRRGPILLSGLLFVLTKRWVDWGLEISPFLIEPSCANGVGVMRLKETHIGSLLLVRSMGLKEEGGALAGLGRAMG